MQRPAHQLPRPSEAEVSRVLRVVTRPNLGGPARQAFALWHAHRALGVQTLLVTGVCRRGEPAFDLEAHGLPRLGFEEAVALGRDALGVCVLGHLGRAVAPWSDLRALSALRALVASFAPDVVHTHTSKAGVLGRLAARDAMVVAHTFHGLVLRDYWSWPLARAARLIEQRLARRTDLLFAVSASCARELEELGVRGRSEVRVVPPAVETAPFAAADRPAVRTAAGVSEGVPLLGFVGRLVPIKRLELFLAVVAALDGAHGIVVGDGPERRLLHGAPRVRWLGAVSEPAEILPGCDVLVVPSRREGFPLVALEAAAAGVPVVGFDVPGVADAVGALRPDLLVPESAGVAGLVRAVRRALASPCAADPAAVAELLARSRPDAVALELLAHYRRARRDRERRHP